MSYPISTRVLIDGVQAHDAGSDLAAGYPTVVDDLAIQWGRQSNVDQPEVGTCTFTLREQLFGTSVAPQSMLNVIHTGSDVEVWALADVPESDAEVMSQTGFNQPGPLDANSFLQVAGTDTPTVTVSRLQGQQAAWIQGTADSYTATIIFPPAAFQPAGQNPDAWDSIPRLLPGQTWPMEVTAWLPPGAGGTLTAYAFTAPHSTPTPVACTVLNAAGNPVVIPADGTWQTVTALVQVPGSIDSDGAWIAPGVSLDPMPSQLQVKDMTGTIADQPFTFADYVRAGISEVSVTQASPSTRDVLVWKGEVTSAVGQAAGPYAATISVTASDVGAAMSNETISDTPWPAQSLEDRTNRILALATSITAPATVDATLQPIQLSYKEVDAQQVLSLLQDNAQSVGGVMWVASHATTGTFLWLEDPASRAAVRKFIIDPVTDAVSIGGNLRDVSVISAADGVLRDPVQWTQDVSQVITSVDVGWLQQGLDTDGVTPTTTDETDTQTDTMATATYGLRKLQISTELTSASDADDLATRLLAQARNTDWLASGLTIDTRKIQAELDDLDYTQRLNTIMDLLDGTTRLGRGVTLIDLPVWTPAGGADTSAYVEGGTYTCSKGAWQLALVVSSAQSGGGNNTAKLSDFPDGVKIADFPDGMRFEDTYGVAGPNFGLGFATLPFTLPALVN